MWGNLILSFFFFFFISSILSFTPVQNALALVTTTVITIELISLGFQLGQVCLCTWQVTEIADKQLTLQSDWGSYKHQCSTLAKMTPKSMTG